MYQEYIQSLGTSQGVVASEFPLDIPSKANVRRVISLSIPSKNNTTIFSVNVEALGIAGAPLYDDDAQVRKARCANALNRLWAHKLKSRQANKPMPKSGSIKAQGGSIETQGAHSSGTFGDSKEYEGALQLRLFPDQNTPIVRTLEQSTTLKGKPKVPKLTLELTSISTNHYGRSSGLGRTSDSSLFATTISSPSTSPPKRLVRFNSCVSRGVFEKEEDETDSEHGDSAFKTEVNPIEQLPPAMILPVPDSKERGSTIIFSPPMHIKTLIEDDLVVCERHPEGIRGIRIRKEQTPHRSLRRTKAFYVEPKPQYEVIAKADIDGLYARCNTEVDMFGNDAGANKALNGGEMFIRGRKIGRKALATTSVANLKDLEWVQVEVQEPTPVAAGDIPEGTAQFSGRLGKLELQEEETETDEEDEDGGVIVRNECDALEAATGYPTMVFGTAVVRGWRAWTK